MPLRQAGKHQHREHSVVNQVYKTQSALIVTREDILLQIIILLVEEDLILQEESLLVPVETVERWNNLRVICGCVR